MSNRRSLPATSRARVGCLVLALGFAVGLQAKPDRNCVVLLSDLRPVGEAAYATNLLVDNFDHVADPRRQLEEALTGLQSFAEHIRPLGSVWRVPEQAPVAIGIAATVVDVSLADTLWSIAHKYRAFAGAQSPSP